MDWQREVSDATEFVEGVKLDIFQDQVFVFTPRGDVKDLPAGATPLDFAYRIHTDVGHACIGAKVNNRLVPLDYKLKNGDIVEIVTTQSAHGPSRDWLNLVTTSHAKEKIRQWFKRQQRDENIVHGKAALDRELRRLARTSLEKIPDELLQEMVDTDHFSTARRLLRGHRLRRHERPAGGHEAGRRGRRAASRCCPRSRRHRRSARAASGSRAWATCWSASPSAATPSRATRSWATSRAAGA